MNPNPSLNQLATIFEKSLLDELWASGEIIDFKAEQIVIDYGKNIRMMPVVLEGTIRVMRRDEEGREILLYYLSNSESCSMAYGCCISSKKSEIKAIAEEDGKLLAVPFEKLNEWLCKYESWRNYIFNSFNDRFIELLNSIDIIAFGKMEDRIVQYLRDKSEITQSKVVKVSHYKIAEELATTRVVVSRILKQMENQKKLILYRNEIKLLNGFFESQHP